MVLVRVAFWLALIIIILPTNAQDQQNVYGLMKATFDDIRTFCVRHSQECKQGRSMFRTIADKMVFGGNLFIDMLREQIITIGKTASSPHRNSANWHLPSQPTNRYYKNTLSQHDLKIEWSKP